ncbi:MAG TPA: nicotinate (nicotinamide) nucleotide adenylyltransferase [Deltaproteobacteria bacterium]|nr:nicotinate (nicotinamide) nucleotide adenylyltransferase [Deltaproteobacteria bacterium]
MRLAVFGGTFNPIHYAHLRVAEEARESLGAERLVFVPSHITPHKQPSAVAGSGKRLRMVELAVSGNPAFEVSDIELRRGGRSFTIDTVRQLRRERACDTVLIIGSDSYNDLGSWYRTAELVAETDFAVVNRPGHEPRPIDEVLPVELAKDFWYDAEVTAYRSGAGRTISFLDTTMLAISASQIRERIGRGASVRYLLPDAVIDYIREEGLYGMERGA